MQKPDGEQTVSAEVPDGKASASAELAFAPKPVFAVPVLAEEFVFAEALVSDGVPDFAEQVFSADWAVL